MPLTRIVFLLDSLLSFSKTGKTHVPRILTRIQTLIQSYHMLSLKPNSVAYVPNGNWVRTVTLERQAQNGFTHLPSGIPRALLSIINPAACLGPLWGNLSSDSGAKNALNSLGILHKLKQPMQFTSKHIRENRARCERWKRDFRDHPK